MSNLFKELVGREGALDIEDDSTKLLSLRDLLWFNILGWLLIRLILSFVHGAKATPFFG